MRERARTSSSHTSRNRTLSAIDSAASPGDGLAVIVLAGGAATRFPGKLRADFGGVPLLQRVVRNVAPAAAELVIAGERDVDAAFAACIGAQVAADEHAFRGPLAGLVSALSVVRARFAFVVAGDAPFVDAALARALAAAWQPGDEAVVPTHAQDGVQSIEPLAALYDLSAARLQAPGVLAGKGSMHALLERLRTRLVALDLPSHTFANVNTPEDYRRLAAPASQDEELGGDAACWLHMVCPACGAFLEDGNRLGCGTCGRLPLPSKEAP